MNLWHQRIIFFAAKVFAVILGLLFIGYLLYYSFYFKQDTLIKYVPTNAIAYATFRITPELGKNDFLSRLKKEFFLKNNLLEPDWDQLNQLVGNNMSIAVFADEQNQSANFDYLFLLNLGPRKSIDQQYSNFIKKIGWYYQLIANQAKSKNILVISNNENILAKVNRVMIKDEPSLAQKVSVILNLKKYSPDSYWGRLYLDSQYLMVRSMKSSDIKTKLALVSLASIGQDQLFFGFLKTTVDNIIVQNTQQKDYNFDYSKISLPPDIEVALSFHNLADKWVELNKYLQKNEIDYYNKLADNIKYYEKLYNFNLSDDILQILAQKMQLLKTEDGVYFISLGLSGTEAEQQISFIEDLIKIYLATSFPVEKKKQLSDYTYITQIIRDLENINFVTEEIDEHKVKVLNYNNQEYAYFVNENNIFLANSREKIIDYIRRNNMSYNLFELSNFSQNIAVNLKKNQELKEITENLNRLYINQEEGTNEILLILE